MPSNLLLEKCGHLTKFSEIFTILPALPNRPAFWAAHENYGLFGISQLNFPYIEHNYFVPKLDLSINRCQNDWFLNILNFPTQSIEQHYLSLIIFISSFFLTHYWQSSFYSCTVVPVTEANLCCYVTIIFPRGHRLS